MNKSQKEAYDVMDQCMRRTCGEEWDREKQIKRTVKQAAKIAAKNSGKEVFYNA